MRYEQGATDTYSIDRQSYATGKDAVKGQQAWLNKQATKLLQAKRTTRTLDEGAFQALQSGWAIVVFMPDIILSRLAPHAFISGDP